MQIDLIELISQASVFMERTCDYKSADNDIFIWYSNHDNESLLELNYSSGYYLIDHTDKKTSYALRHLLSEQDELKNYQEITK